MGALSFLKQICWSALSCVANMQSKRIHDQLNRDIIEICRTNNYTSCLKETKTISLTIHCNNCLIFR